MKVHVTARCCAALVILVGHPYKRWSSAELLLIFQDTLQMRCDAMRCVFKIRTFYCCSGVRQWGRMQSPKIFPLASHFTNYNRWKGSGEGVAVVGDGDPPPHSFTLALDGKFELHSRAAIFNDSCDTLQQIAKCSLDEFSSSSSSSSVVVVLFRSQIIISSSWHVPN